MKSTEIWALALCSAAQLTTATQGLVKDNMGLGPNTTAAEVSAFIEGMSRESPVGLPARDVGESGGDPSDVGDAGDVGNIADYSEASAYTGGSNSTAGNTTSDTGASTCGFPALTKGAWDSGVKDEVSQWLQDQATEFGRWTEQNEGMKMTFQKYLSQAWVKADAVGNITSTSFCKVCHPLDQSRLGY